jgi:hypothetical protein
MSVGYFTSNSWSNIQWAAIDLRAYIEDVEKRPVSEFAVKTELEELMMNSDPQLAAIKDNPEKIKEKVLEHLYKIVKSLETVVAGFRAAEEMSYQSYSPAGFLYKVEKS